jgi:hypothetical protein
VTSPCFVLNAHSCRAQACPTNVPVYFPVFLDDISTPDAQISRFLKMLSAVNPEGTNTPRDGLKSFNCER